MRYVPVPESVTPAHGLTEKTIPLTVQGERPPDDVWSMYTYLVAFPFNDEKMGTSRKHIKAVKKIKKLFKDATPGQVIPVEDADWEMVRDCIETPTVKQPGGLMVTFVDFMDAWCDAKDEAPKKPVNGKVETVDTATKEGVKPLTAEHAEA